MRIYIGLNGEGLGHYSRAISLYEEAVKAGHDVVMATYGVAYDKARSENVNVKEVKREVVMSGDAGVFSLSKTLFKSSALPVRMYKSYKYEKRLMKYFDIIVSDARVSTILAGYRSKKPVFLMCNQTKCPKTQNLVSPEVTEEILDKLSNLGNEINLRLIEQSMQISLISQYFLADEILIGDFKPPTTVSLPLLSHKPNIKKKTVITGPLNRMVKGFSKRSWKSLGFKNPRRKKVFMTIGGQMYRKNMIPVMLNSFKLVDADLLFSHFSIDKGFKRDNICLKPFNHNIYSYMATADIHVIPAGNAGIMESMIMEVPALLIPDSMQPEQISNAKRYKKLGFGEFITHEQLNEDKLSKKISFMLDNINTYKKRLRGLNKRARTTDNGPRNALKRIEDMYDRYYSW